MDWTARAREITRNYIMLGREELASKIAALAAEAYQAGQREKEDECETLRASNVGFFDGIKGRRHEDMPFASSRNNYIWSVARDAVDKVRVEGHAAGVAEERARCALDAAAGGGA